MARHPRPGGGMHPQCGSAPRVQAGWRAPAAALVPDEHDYGKIACLHGGEEGYGCRICRISFGGILVAKRFAKRLREQCGPCGPRAVAKDLGESLQSDVV